MGQVVSGRRPLLGLLPSVPAALIAAGTLTGTRGEVVTTVRAGSRNCVGLSGTVSLSANQPCVEVNGLLSEQAADDSVVLPATAVPVAAGTVEVTFTPKWSSSPGATILDTRTANNQAGFAMYVASGETTLTFQVAGSTLASSSLTWTNGTAYRLKATWGSGNVYLYRNGALVGSATAGTFLMPTAQMRVGLGTNLGDAFQCNCWLRDLRFYP